MPKNTFKKLANKPFMKAILERINYERQGKNMPQGTIMDLFPQPTDTCLPGIKARDEFCNIGIVDMTDFGSVDGKEITHDTIESIFDTYCVVQGCSAIWRSVQDDLFETLPNPGV